MPNWVRNECVLKGTEEQMLNLFNDALANSGEEKKDNVQDALDTLVSNGKHKESNREDAFDNKPQKRDVVLVKGFTLRTIRPCPDTFLEYDTTNYKDKFEEQAKEQLKQYGVVGWYDYNVKTLGTKWDAEIEGARLTKQEDGTYMFYFTCDSAWSPITIFLGYLTRQYGVRTFICAIDEGYGFVFYEDSYGNGKDYTQEIADLFEKFKDEEETETLYDEVGRLEDKMIYEFDEFVCQS